MTSVPAAPRSRRAARTPGGSPQRGPEGGKVGGRGRRGDARRTACATATRHHAHTAAERRSGRSASPQQPSAPSEPSSPANTATYTNARMTPTPRAPRRSNRPDSGYTSASTSLHETTGCHARYGPGRTLIRRLIYEDEHLVRARELEQVRSAHGPGGQDRG